MAEVESFQLDHTKVLAPYVRLIGSETGPKGDVITNFEHSSEEIAKVIKSSLEELASDEFGWDNVPGVAEKECGNYRNHSLFGAKEWSKKILSEGISTDPYERKVI